MASFEQNMANFQQTVHKHWLLLLEVLSPSLGSFQHTVLNWWLLVCTLGPVYFFVVGLSSLSAAFLSKGADAARSLAPPPSSSHHCSPERLWAVMDIWLRWMATLLVGSIIFTHHVKTLVETAAAIEAKLYGEETKAYKALCNESKEADTALAQINVAGPNYELEVNRCWKLAERVVKEKPKEGLARVSTSTRKWMRRIFAAAILCSFGTGFCASVAFYLSLQMRAGCRNRAAEIIPHILVGIAFLGLHLNALIVAFSRD